VALQHLAYIRRCNSLGDRHHRCNGWTNGCGHWSIS